AGVGRAGLYIVERGYCTTEELPVFARAAGDDAEGQAAAMGILRRQLALRMGREDVPEPLASIGSMTDLGQALSSYAQSSPAVLKILRAWSGYPETESGDVS